MAITEVLCLSWKEDIGFAYCNLAPRGVFFFFFSRARWTALAYHPQHKKSTCWTTEDYKGVFFQRIPACFSLTEIATYRSRQSMGSATPWNLCWNLKSQLILKSSYISGYWRSCDQIHSGCYDFEIWNLTLNLWNLAPCYQLRWKALPKTLLVAIRFTLH